MRVSIQFPFPRATRSSLPDSHRGPVPRLVGAGRSVAAVAFVAAVVAVVAGVSPAAVAAGTCYPPPVEAPVAVAYREPACRYCAGHRGIDFDSRAGDSVRAVAAGEVTFAGSVAGTRYVVVAHADGLRATYGGLDRVLVAEGGVVRQGQRLATAGGLLYFGLRRGDEYVDPTPLLGRWRRQVRLVPTDGSARRPAPPARLECPEQTRDR
jgi:murein DD-endopeptidase MepM/ murein hydrolase activator NlpD